MDILDELFNVKINVMDDVDLDIIALIEEKCTNGESLNQDEVDYYLSYVIYQTRALLSLKKFKEVSDYNYSFMCDTAQSIIARYFDRLNISYKPVETGKAISEDILGHSFLTVDFNVLGNEKSYLLDPTFNQFFDKEKCTKDNFKMINGLLVKTPDLGYFVLNEDLDIIKNLMAFGYMELTEEHAKIYGDLFYKTKLGHINYFNSKLEMNGKIYIKGFKNSPFKLSYTYDELKALGIALEPICKNNLKKIV